MNIVNIEAFIYILHFGSFKKAANALFISQSTITARIKSLEEDIGFKLLHRNGKQVTLTEKGKHFFPHAQQILKSYRMAVSNMNDRDLSEELRIGATSTVSNYILPDVLSHFAQERPDLKLRIISKASDVIAEKVINQELDVGFVRKVDHPDLDTYHYSDHAIRLFVPSGHPLLSEDQVTLAKVGAHPLIFLECGSLDWESLHRVFDSLDQSPRIIAWVDHIEVLKKLIIRRMGIGFLPDFCVEQEVKEQTLIPVDVPDMRHFSLSTHVIVPKGTDPAFIHSLRNAYYNKKEINNNSNISNLNSRI